MIRIITRDGNYSLESLAVEGGVKREVVTGITYSSKTDRNLAASIAKSFGVESTFVESSKGRSGSDNIETLNALKPGLGDKISPILLQVTRDIAAMNAAISEAAAKRGAKAPKYSLYLNGERELAEFISANPYEN